MCAAVAFEPLVRPRVAEFFAGIGLVRRGIEAAGFEVVFANDIDPVKRQFYGDNFPTDEFYLGDVTSPQDVTGDQIPDIEVATASFRCTDLSLAGNRAGLLGSRSGAFWGLISASHGDGVPAPAGRDAGECPKPRDLSRRQGSLIHHHRAQRAGLRLRYFASGCQVVCAPKPNAPLHRGLAGPFEFSRACGDRQSSAPRGLSALSSPIPIFNFKLRHSARRRCNHRILARAWNGSLLTTNDGGIGRRREVHRLLVGAPGRPAGAIALRGISPFRDCLPSYAWEGCDLGDPMDGISGCLRTARGGSSKQAVVGGQGCVRVRWMTSREYAALQGAPDLVIRSVTENQALFGLGDAVCVPAVAWLAREYLRPLIEGRLTGRAALAYA